jgi:hypothetical protein
MALVGAVIFVAAKYEKAPAPRHDIAVTPAQSNSTSLQSVPMESIAVSERPFVIGEGVPAIESETDVGLPFAPVESVATDAQAVVPAALPLPSNSSPVPVPIPVASTSKVAVADAAPKTVPKVSKAQADRSQRPSRAASSEPEPSAMVLDTAPSVPAVVTRSEKAEPSKQTSRSDIAVRPAEVTSAARSSKAGRLVDPVEETVPQFRSPSAVNSTK